MIGDKKHHFPATDGHDFELRRELWSVLYALASVDVFIRARCGYGDVNYMAFSPTSTLSTAVERRQIESLHKNGET